MRVTRGFAATLGILVGLGVRHAAGSEPAPDLLVAARAWYAAIDAGAEAGMAAHYVAAADPAARLRDLAALRGSPIEFGMNVRSDSDREAWLHVHAATGEFSLVSWKRVEGVWKITGVVAIAPAIFLSRRESPVVAAWPSEAAERRTPAGLVFGLAKALRQEKVRLTQKALEVRFLRPALPTDRENYPELLSRLGAPWRLPEIRSVTEMGEPGTRTATGVVAGDLEVRFSEADDGWRIVSVSPKGDGGARSGPSPAVRAAISGTAGRVLAAISASDAATLAAIALDPTSPTPRGLSPEQAKALVLRVRKEYGARFETEKAVLCWAPELLKISFSVEAPVTTADSKWAFLDFVLIGDSWRLLDVNDGGIRVVATAEEELLQK